MSAFALPVVAIRVEAAPRRAKREVWRLAFGCLSFRAGKRGANERAVHGPLVAIRGRSIGGVGGVADIGGVCLGHWRFGRKLHGLGLGLGCKLLNIRGLVVRILTVGLLGAYGDPARARGDQHAISRAGLALTR